MPRIALTGGVASGKSTVAQLFAALGAKLIDTDQIARDIVAPPSLVLDQIVARFGPAVLNARRHAWTAAACAASFSTTPPRARIWKP